MIRYGLLTCMMIVFINVTVFALKNSSELYKQGIVKAKNGDIDGAILVFKEVNSISPYFSLGHYGLGKCYLYKENMTDEAIKELKLAVKYDKKLSRAYFYLGMANMYKNDFAPAVEAFQKAYATDKRNIEALYNIGSIYDLMGHGFLSQKYYSQYFKRKAKEDIFNF